LATEKLERKSFSRSLQFGHSLVQGLYLLLDRRCPLAPHLYRQEKVCQAEDVAFSSKIELFELFAA